MGKWQPVWRWPVYITGVLVLLAASLWCFGAILAGGGMGWGNRPSVQITLLVLTIGVTFGLTFFTALRAMMAAQNRRPTSAYVMLALSFLPVPLLYVALELRWL